jgi:Peptide methionine sulfoxide reductase
MTEERAVLAGGCFWGVQDLIRRYDGVLSTRVGYTGGSVSHATYRNHGSHAEAVEVIFDPARVSYRQILEFFFQIHDRPRAIARATTSGPATDLRSSTPVTSRSGLPKTPSPTSIFRPVAGQGRYGSRSGRRLLGGRTRASGLSPTISRRLHLPFRPSPLETADSHRQDCKALVTADRPANRTLGTLGGV